MINDLNQTYNKHFDYDYERGMVGENYLKEYVHGTHEVKTEYLTIKTGNFYIETFQYNINGEWPSGINVTTATHWVFASTTGEGGTPPSRPTTSTPTPPKANSSPSPPFFAICPTSHNGTRAQGFAFFIV